MAIDSQEKRESIGNLAWSLILPKPINASTAGSRMQSMGEYALHPWKSADSVLLDTDWDDSANAHDNNVATYAVGSEPTLFTELQMAFSPAIRTDLWRIYAEGNTGGDTFNPDITVKLWYNGGWVTAWNGSITKAEWYEYPPQGAVWVSKVSIVDNESGYDYLRVYEFQLLNLAITLPDAVIPKVGGGMARNSLLGSGLIT